MPRRKTELRADAAERRNAWMARRIRYFGKPCLTSQEYRAVVYSLYGLPQVTRDIETGTVLVPLEAPTQRYVATKMTISQARVSQLLAKAADALTWLDDAGVTGVGWRRQGSTWHFEAPVMDKPDPALRRTQVRVVADRSRQSYKLAFAGEV